LKLCFLVPTRVHNPNSNRSVQPFLHSSRQKVNGCPFPKKLPLPMKDLVPHLIHDSLGQSEPKTQMASPPVVRFSCFCTDDCRVSQYFTMGHPFPPSKLPFPWGIWTPSNTWFPGPTQVLNPIGHIYVCSTGNAA